MRILSDVKFSNRFLEHGSHLLFAHDFQFFGDAVVDDFNGELPFHDTLHDSSLVEGRLALP